MTVAAGSVDAGEEAVAAEAAEVVGHLARRVAGQGCGDERQEAGVGDAFEEVREGAEGCEQRLHARVAEAERGGGQAVVGAGRQHDAFEGGDVGRACARLELGVEEPLVDGRSRTSVGPALSGSPCEIGAKSRRPQTAEASAPDAPVSA